MADLLIAEQAAVVAKKDANGRLTRRTIKEGKIYRSDDPVVKGREHLFRPVEDTTASPGEKRSIGRPRKKTAPEPVVVAETKPPAKADADEGDK